MQSQLPNEVQLRCRMPGPQTILIER